LENQGDTRAVFAACRYTGRYEIYAALEPDDPARMGKTPEQITFL
jgi:hypothetical protein